MRFAFARMRSADHTLMAEKLYETAREFAALTGNETCTTSTAESARFGLCSRKMRSRSGGSTSRGVDRVRARERELNGIGKPVLRRQRRPSAGGAARAAAIRTSWW